MEVRGSMKTAPPPSVQLVQDVRNTMGSEAPEKESEAQLQCKLAEK